MADLTKTVEIIFSGIDSSLTKTLDNTVGRVEDFSAGIEGATQPLADMTTVVVGLDAALVGLAAAGFTYAIGKAFEFEAASKGLEKVLNDEAGRIGEAEQAALGLSNAYGVTATSALDSAANFKQAGFTLDESLQLAANSLDLMIAGDLEAAQASDILVATLKGFNAPASEAARVIDVLNEVSNQYATDVEQLGEGMARLSPVASQMGFTFEETAGLLTPIIEVFRSGDEAANGLRTGLLKLTDDSKPVTDALAAIGVSQTDANGVMKSGKEVFYEVAQAMQGLSKEEQLYYTQQLVGIEQAPKMVLAFTDIEKVMSVTATAMNSAGSAAAEVAVKMESGPVIADKYKVSFENLAVAVGKKFLDASKDAIKGATDINTALQASLGQGAFDPILDTVDGFLTDIGALFADIAAALPEALAQIDWTELTGAIEGVEEALAAMFGDLDLTDPEQLAEAIQFVVDSTTSLINVSKGVIDALTPWFQSLLSGVSSFNQLSAAEQATVGETLGLGTAINTAAGLFGSLVTALQAAGAGMAALAGTGGIALLNAAFPTLGAVVGGAASAFGPFLVGGAIAAGVAYVASEITDKLIPSADEAAAKQIHIDTKLFLDQFEADVQKLEAETDKALEMAAQIAWDKNDVTTQELLELIENGASDEEINYAFKGDTASLKGALDEAGVLVESFKGDLSNIPEHIETAIQVFTQTGDMEALKAELAKLPPEQAVKLAVATVGDDPAAVAALVDGIPDEKLTKIIAKNEATEGINKVHEELRTLEDGTLVPVKVYEPIPVADTVKNVDNELKKLPPEKQVELLLKSELEKQIAEIEGEFNYRVEAMKSEAATMQTAIEWSAKMDIAEAEAEAKKFENALAATAQTTDTLTDSLVSMLSIWAGGSLSDSEKTWMKGIIEEELALQKQSVDTQNALIQAQTEYLELKNKQLQSGDALIRIESDGLEPALEMIMWEILEKVQLRVNEEAGAMLLGI